MVGIPEDLLYLCIKADRSDSQNSAAKAGPNQDFLCDLWTISSWFTASVEIPSRELTCPWEKGKSSSKVPWEQDSSQLG